MFDFFFSNNDEKLDHDMIILSESFVSGPGTIQYHKQYTIAS